MFSAHNLVKSKLRTDLGMEASAAQVRAHNGSCCYCFCCSSCCSAPESSASFLASFPFFVCVNSLPEAEDIAISMQTRICMMKKKLGPFGSEKMEAFVDKVYEAMEEEKMWPRFKVDMAARDALDGRIKSEREHAVAQARDSIRKEMEPEIRSQVQAAAQLEVCSHP